jgi:hypothetical protein
METSPVIIHLIFSEAYNYLHTLLTSKLYKKLIQMMKTILNKQMNDSMILPFELHNIVYNCLCEVMG